MPLVSVIVPVYKVEKYINRCVDSLRKQTLKDIEIILVDDGSPDRCPEICDEYANGDSRIVVVHKKNGGLSSARNAGINVATGKYLGFVDSDDFVDADMFVRLYSCIEENQVDFVMEDYWKVDADENKKVKTLDIRAGRYDKENIVNEIFPILIMRETVDYGPLLSVWHCLYKTDFIKENCLFFDEEIKWSEDCIFSAILGYKVNSFFYMKNICGYNYCQNEGSISKSYKSAAWDVYCLMNDKLREYFKNKTEYDFSRQLDIHMLYFACSVFNQLQYSGMTFWEKYKVRKRILDSQHLRKAMSGFTIPKMNLKSRVFFWLIKVRAALVISITS